MTDSILESTKKLLNIHDDSFDLDILTHINTAFVSVTQLGIGPPQGYMITGPEQMWSDFIGEDIRLNSVKSYVVLRVRMLFDPPTSAFLVNSLKEMKTELEWRLNVDREEVSWMDPRPLLES